jgi:hypothetical protein
MERMRPSGVCLKCGFLLSVVCLLSATASGSSGYLSYTGTLGSAQSVFEVTFTLTVSDTVTVQTWGFGGGTNAAGQVISAGGFDPLIALFKGSVTTATMYVDGSGNPLADAANLINASWSYVGNCPAARTVFIGANMDCGDVKMQVALPAGTYTLVLTDANYQPAAIYDNGTLSEGFTDLTEGVFQTCDTDGSCITPSGHYGVDIVSTKSGLTAFSLCDLNQDGFTNVADVQRMINEALGVMSATHDLNGDGMVNVVDIQIVINAALSLGCAVN